MEKTAFEIGAEDALEKTAKKKEKKDPGYWAKQRAAGRAIRAGDKGLDRYMIDPKLMHERRKESLKGLARGGLKGAGAGAAAGALSALISGQKGRALNKALVGAGLGAYVGGAAGSTKGMIKSDIEFLKKKGFKPKWGGLSVELDAKAKKKYLSKKYKGGGAED